MTTLVTGAGLIGTAFAQNALARGEQVVFVDPEPRADFPISRPPSATSTGSRASPSRRRSRTIWLT